MKKKLKLLMVSSILAIHLYILIPFINGIGCNYNSTSLDDGVVYMSSCRLGIMETIIWDKHSGERKRYVGIYAKKKNNSFFLVLKSIAISKGKMDNSKLSTTFGEPFFFAAKQVHQGDHDIVLLRTPFFRAYKTHVVGRLGFW